MDIADYVVFGISCSAVGTSEWQSKYEDTVEQHYIVRSYLTTVIARYFVRCVSIHKVQSSVFSYSASILIV